MLFTMIGIMLAHIFCTYIIRYDYASSTGYFAYASTYYILMSIFLAIAVCYPDMSVLYAMIIPIKMKYLSILYIVIIAYYFINETFMGRVNIAMSLVSFVISIFGQIQRKLYSKRKILSRKTACGQNGGIATGKSNHE